MAILQAKDVVKIYSGDVKAVAGISFTVEEGEVFGFLGPNGAGKTTTIRIGVTLLALTSGTIVIDGIDVQQRPEEVRRRIGYAAQSVGVDDDLTGRENLILQGRLHGLSSRSARVKADELLEVIDLRDAATRRAGTFSGGMRKRLDLAQALVHHPRLLFLDEPTTGLDPQNRRALWTYLRGLNESGVTIFLTTQYLEEADVLCGRLAIIDHGLIKVEGSPAELKAGLGGDTVTVTLPREAATNGPLERTRAVLASVDGCSSVAVHENSVSVILRDGGAQLADLVRALDAAAVPVARLELAEPTLDDVFLKHTGERLRVDEVKPPSRVIGRRRGGRV
jgi:ABC-2 type transport system ATP-binding protein